MLYPLELRARVLHYTRSALPFSTETGHNWGRQKRQRANQETASTGQPSGPPGETCIILLQKEPIQGIFLPSIDSGNPDREHFYSFDEVKDG